MTVLALRVLMSAILGYLSQVEGHGRMIEPASRNSMWRYGYQNPRNYNDMGLNCGGFTNQFERQHGRCGVCGDPYQGSRDHEAGGRYARGVIARQYQPGAYINVTVELTSNHMGYFEFRLCPVNDPRKKASQACLDRHVLTIIGHGQRYFISRRDTTIISEMFVQLPPNLKCSQCVLQWKWVAGQSMGPDGYGGECLGCGNQEHFINCADIAIGMNPVAPLPMPAGGFTEPEPIAPPAAPESSAAGYGNPAIDTKPGHTGPSYQHSGLPAGVDANMANIIAQVYKMASKANRIMPPQLPTWNPTTPKVNTKPKLPDTTMYQTTTTSWVNSQGQQSWQQPMQQANNWATSGNMMTPPIQAQHHAAAFYNQPAGWNQNMAQSASSVFQQNSEYNPSDYAGNEPGEYPELSELPPPNVHMPGNTAQYSNSASSSYQQGFSDAINHLKQQLGLSNGNTAYTGKINTALSELSMTMQESQKPHIQPGGAASMHMCPGGAVRECVAGGAFHGNSDFDSWCTMSCATGQCPATMCSCTCPGGGGGWGAAAGCRAVDRTKGASMDTWCEANCKQNNCPSDLCVCGFNT